MMKGVWIQGCGGWIGVAKTWGKCAIAGWHWLHGMVNMMMVVMMMMERLHRCGMLLLSSLPFPHNLHKIGSSSSLLPKVEADI